MLKKLQEHVNRGTKEAEETAKKGDEAKPKAAKLADKQEEIEEMARKVGEKAAAQRGGGE